MNADATTTTTIDGVTNLRDLGGTRLRPGLVFRSGTLHKATESGLAALAALGLRHVVDFRADAEAESQGLPVLPEGITLLRLPVGGGSVAEWEVRLPGLDTPAKTLAFVEDLYRGYVSDPVSRAQFAATLRLIADAEAPVLIHCTAGKDRTGFATAVLLTILGVPRDEVYADYLRSRAALEALNADLGALFVGLGLDPVALAPLLDVHESCLDAAFAQIDAEFGSVDAFVTDGLGLTDDVVARLRTRLLAPG
ncbi:tyrosine-protein phosphatase [Nocardia salmonicida]|uniref:tyrosine-protein phosphatase n=1 Tax=Nocardia salmonicida TaxID=53431 RepID=UPI0033C555B8